MPVLRDAVAAHHGEVFNYTGDGMCAVFASPRSAVHAAVAAQRVLELLVRMGIATGEAELGGDDYFGTVLNRTARVMAAGHGGQILLDGATAGLADGVSLIPLGPRRLRDIAKPVEMFQARAPGLPTEFPPPKTADPPRETCVTRHQLCRAGIGAGRRPVGGRGTSRRPESAESARLGWR
jgi:class 3 adenylate cyclase